MRLIFFAKICCPYLDIRGEVQLVDGRDHGIGVDIGSVKDFSQNGLQTLVRVKSAGNGGILKGSLQMLHVHVLLVAPLGAGHMA